MNHHEVVQLHGELTKRRQLGDGSHQAIDLLRRCACTDTHVESSEARGEQQQLQLLAASWQRLRDDLAHQFAQMRHTSRHQ
jgi:hypothetical protein